MHYRSVFYVNDWVGGTSGIRPSANSSARKASLSDSESSSMECVSDMSAMVTGGADGATDGTLNPVNAGAAG